MSLLFLLLLLLLSFFVFFYLILSKSIAKPSAVIFCLTGCLLREYFSLSQDVYMECFIDANYSSIITTLDVVASSRSVIPIIKDTHSTSFAVSMIPLPRPTFFLMFVLGPFLLRPTQVQQLRVCSLRMAASTPKNSEPLRIVLGVCVYLEARSSRRRCS